MSFRLFLVFILLATLSCAQRSSIRLANAVQAQCPPVARVGHPWTFTLLSNTFVSRSHSSLNYSATGLPAWVTFDASTLAFSGTPQASDEGSTIVTVQASTSNGNSQDSFDLLVSSQPAPTVTASVQNQLPDAASLEGACIAKNNGWLRVPPHWHFQIDLQPDTFVDSSSQPIYYASYLQGTTSLPSWLNFDNSTITFEGEAPDGGVYPLILYGSTVFGYGDVQEKFTIYVDEHFFDLKQPLPTLNSTQNGPVNYTIPYDHFEIDYIPVTLQNISAIHPDLADFPNLAFSFETRSFTGSLAGSTSTTLPVNFTSSYGDRVNTSVTIELEQSLFSAAQLPTLNLKPGADFDQKLSSYLNSSSTQYSAAFNPTSVGQWASFNEQTRSISGKVPQNLSYSSAQVTLSAYDNVTGVSDSSILPLDLTGTGKTQAAMPTTSNSMSDKTKIGLAAGFGALAFLMLLALLFWCCKKRRRTSQELSKELYIPTTSLMTPATKSTPFFKSSPFMDDKTHFNIQPVPVPAIEEPKSKSGKTVQRFGLMKVFGQSKQQDLAVAEEDNNSMQMHGLGISSPDHSRVIIMEDGVPTYHPHSASSSELDHSSWGSKASSSLFYSDSESRDGKGQDSLRSNGSAPRQRSGFTSPHILPPPLASPRMDSPIINSPIMTENDPFLIQQQEAYAGIRSSRSQPRIADVEDDSLEVAAITAATFVSRAPSTDRKSMPYRDSPRPSTQPRLIPFASEKRASRSSRLSTHSLTQNDDATADAIDHRASVQYVPPLDGAESPVRSPIFFSTPREQFDTPATSNENPFRSRPASARTRSPDRKSKTLEIIRQAVDINHPFHFTPVLNPVPELSSPGRGSQPKGRYIAVLDAPDDSHMDRKPLPDWLHWSEQDLEFWGVAPGQQLGESIAVQVIRLKPSGRQSSPKRHERTTSEPDTELVCGRFVLEVLDRRRSRIPDQAFKVVAF